MLCVEWKKFLIQNLIQLKVKKLELLALLIETYEEEHFKNRFTRSN